MDAAGKQRVQDALVARARQGLAEPRSEVAEAQAGARLDQDAAYDIDDQWQADTEGDLEGIFERVESTRQEAVDQLAGLDFAVTDVVAPGAIVGIDGQRHVFGASFGEEIEVDGVTYEALSADSPLGEVVAGLKLGDRFTFRDREQSIDFLA